jgi:hypothetical protein
VKEPCSSTSVANFDMQPENYAISPHAAGVAPIRDGYEYEMAEDEVKLELIGYRQLDNTPAGR